MTRNILAVIAGSVSWTVLWLTFMAFLKSAGQLPAEPTAPVERTSSLLMLLVASIVFSIVAGYVAALIPRGATYGPVIALCALQLTLGVFFQLQSWKLMPVWYHLAFLLLLTPATLLGAALRLR